MLTGLFSALCTLPSVCAAFSAKAKITPCQDKRLNVLSYLHMFWLKIKRAVEIRFQKQLYTSVKHLS